MRTSAVLVHTPAAVRASAVLGVTDCWMAGARPPPHDAAAAAARNHQEPHQEPRPAVRQHMAVELARHNQPEFVSWLQHLAAFLGCRWSEVLPSTNISSSNSRANLENADIILSLYTFSYDSPTN